MKERLSSTLGNSQYYNNIGSCLKTNFGCKVIKLSLDGGFTCPNRDGSLGTGGCIFCSEKGSGDFAGDFSFSIHDQLTSQISLIKSKWPDGLYIAYFQKFTNTYGDIKKMRALFNEALDYPGVIGLAIATRPDCLDDEVLALLKELDQSTFLWVELGLQTIHEKTADLINRCYPLSVFDRAMEKLSMEGIRTVVHLILGLPGETRQDMLASAKYVAALPVFGLKLQLLHILKNTRLQDLYEMADGFSTLSKDEYVHLIVDILEILPPEITIHRLTGDAPRNELVAPLWSSNKMAVLNSIHQEFKRRKTRQGSKLIEGSSYLVSSSLPSL